MERLYELLRKLPPSTNSWTCRWYWTIMYLSVLLIGLGATVIPGDAGLYAIILGGLSVLVSTLMRRTNESCEL